jgi:hypothetical protein
LKALATWLALGGAIAQPIGVRADQEASNVPHVSAGPGGRCYAKSVPKDYYDLDDARQAGHTRIYRVETGGDTLLDAYDWFSQTIFLLCDVGPQRETAAVRLGPWQRGHDPKPDHLAIAFYLGGQLRKAYSTLDIAGPERASGSSPWHENVSASVSHYTVFVEPLRMVRLVTEANGVFQESWTIEATTVDGRVLAFDIPSGDIISEQSSPGRANDQ